MMDRGLAGISRGLLNFKKNRAKKVCSEKIVKILSLTSSNCGYLSDRVLCKQNRPKLLTNDVVEEDVLWNSKGKR